MNDLSKRTFKTLDFHKKLQDHLTPAGLAFFQSDYDTNVKDFYHNVLNVKEPIFEYDFPKPYHPPERYFPLKQAFNLYLDRYRDPKQINKEFLVRELKKTHPFDGPEPPKRFPAAHSLKGNVSYQRKIERNKQYFLRETFLFFKYFLNDSMSLILK